MPGPLAGLTILDLTQHICGPYATKLLADFGANVIKVERPGGDVARRLGPFQGDAAHPEKSGTFFFFNTNKRSIELDLTSDDGRATLWQLVDRADAVVESYRPGVLGWLGFSWDAIHKRRPDIPLVSISNFGQDSPYRDYLGSELTLYALAGEMYTMGIAEREPVTMYGAASLVESGAAAASATFAAIFASKRDGIGQHVDFSIADSHFLGADRRHVGTIAFQFSGRRSPRASHENRPALTGVYPCADGFVEFSAAGGRLDRLAKMLGNPEWMRDPEVAPAHRLARPRKRRRARRALLRLARRAHQARSLGGRPRGARALRAAVRCLRDFRRRPLPRPRLLEHRLASRDGRRGDPGAPVHHAEDPVGDPPAAAFVE